MKIIKKEYILEVDVKYPKELYDSHSDLPFLPKRMKIDKCKKLVCNLQKKKKYVVHIKSLKQALNHGFNIRKHRDINLVTTDKKRNKLVSEPKYHTIN